MKNSSSPRPLLLKHEVKEGHSWDLGSMFFYIVNQGTQGTDTTTVDDAATKSVTYAELAALERGSSHPPLLTGVTWCRPSNLSKL